MTDDATDAHSDQPDDPAPAPSEPLEDEGKVETCEDLAGTFQDETGSTDAPPEPEAAPAPTGINKATPEPAPAPVPPEVVVVVEPAPAPDPHTQKLAYGPGDVVFIHANSGKFVAEVVRGYPNYDEAEADYELSFQTIVKKGPLYDYTAEHYLCHLANPGKSPIGACVLDTTLKAKCED
jgi:hypothetical protein